MELLDARRLTGPNLLCHGSGTIADIACEPDEAPRLIEHWQRAVTFARERLDWLPSNFYSRMQRGGLSVAFTAPIDQLYAATEINEWAAVSAIAELNGTSAPEFETLRASVSEALAEETNPLMRALQAEAARRGIAFLWDDDEVSLGMGSHSRTWPFAELPPPTEVDWSTFADIPVGIVTGTNGKTTTARLAAFILKRAGLTTGLSCTDSLSVDGEVIDRGDWSGPGGARQILRERRVNGAVLEAARGGLLRRGLGVERAKAAAITNIAADHLGDFGSRTLDELLDIKWIISQSVVDDGYLILNADDERLVAKAVDYPGEIVWFSLNADHPVIQAHLSAGGEAFAVEGDALCFWQGAEITRLCPVSEIGITLKGAARHNIANALTAAALTHAMGVSFDDIVSGLTGISQEDNPGRCNVYAVGGVHVLVDFAHNPHAVTALFDVAAALPAKRRLLAFSQAGDRPDELMVEMTEAAWAIGLDEVYVSELAAYHRGRRYLEVFGLVKAELLRLGAGPEQVHHFDREIDALESALAWAEPGDLVIMLALGERDAILGRLGEVAARD